MTSTAKAWRDRNPLEYAYSNLKHNAKRRGKVFTLTLEQFKQFAKKTDYIAKKGIKGVSYHVDRINENEGYTVDNIQILTNSENIKKYKRFQFNEKGERDFLVETVRPADTSGAPF